MSDNQTFTKEKLIGTIEKLEENPNDRVGVLADVGVTAIGVAGAGVVAAALGTTTASIPLITAVTGIGIVAAAPAALVAGAAVAGGAALFGISRLIKDGGFNEGKRKQLLNEYKEKLNEIEAKDRQSNLNQEDKTEFYSFLKEPLKNDLISADDAHQLMQAVENGYIPLDEAYKLVGHVFPDSQVTHLRKPEKVIIDCPKCSQQLRAPNNLGQLKLTCPSCQFWWLWTPE